jgi:hypothetical protein
MHSDGAAAIVLVSGEKAKKLGLQVIARIRGYADAAQVTLCMTPVLIHCLNKFCVNEGNYPFSWNQYLFSIQFQCHWSLSYLENSFIVTYHTEHHFMSVVCTPFLM